MLRCMRQLLLTLAVLALAAHAAAAQDGNVRKQDPLPIDSEMRTRTIDGVLKLLMDNYVFPEMAEKMQAAVRARQEKKEYDNVTTGQDLAKALTEQLQEISKDKHLRVNCNTEKRQKPAGAQVGQAERFRTMARMANGGYQKVERLPGNVGYLELTGFMEGDIAKERAAAAMNFLSGTDALIIDIRRNGGGSPRAVALVCSYLFDETPIHINSFYHRKGDRTEDFHTLKEVAGKRYLNKDVYVLTAKYTFSAAEEFAYNLKNMKRASIVGETTGGGAHPGGMFPVGDHFGVFVPTGRAINPITKTNWEGVGVIPDIVTTADKALDAAHQKALERLLANANDITRRLIEEDLDRAKVARPAVATKDR
ncbi:MAG: S41 family peptidase [Planctomycetes bacterium]|nr:S41 family peptidase [Planctomycetota bacterium]